MLPDAPPGLSRPTFSLSRPGVTRTGSLNVTVNMIVSYEWYVSPDCGADATTTEVTLGGTTTTVPRTSILTTNRVNSDQLPDGP